MLFVTRARLGSDLNLSRCSHVHIARGTHMVARPRLARPTWIARSYADVYCLQVVIVASSKPELTSRPRQGAVMILKYHHHQHRRARPPSMTADYPCCCSSPPASGSHAHSNHLGWGCVASPRRMRLPSVAWCIDTSCERMRIERMTRGLSRRQSGNIKRCRGCY